jgi:hypothetical protein
MIIHPDFENIENVIEYSNEAQEEENYVEVVGELAFASEDCYDCHCEDGCKEY